MAKTLDEYYNEKATPDPSPEPRSLDDYYNAVGVSPAKPSVAPDYDARDKRIETVQAIRDGSGVNVGRSDSILNEADAIGFFESTTAEFLRGAKGAQLVPFVGGAVEAAEQLQLLDAAGRLKEDFDYSKPVRKAELRFGAMGQAPDVFRTKEQDVQLISDYVQRRMDVSKRGYKWHGVAAKGLIQMPTWMLEFMLTGGLAKIGNEAVQTAGEKLLKSYAKTKLGQVGLKTAGWAGGAVTRASLGLAPRVGAKAITRQVQVELLGADKEGWATSFVKAWGDVVIESASEEAGATITKGLGWVVGKTRLGAKLVPALQKAWMKATGGSAGAFVRGLASKGGYSNIVGEIGEERLGTVLRAVVGVDDFGAGPNAGPMQRLVEGLKQDAENFGAELAVLGVPMASQVVVGRAMNRMNIASTRELLSMLDPLMKADPDRGKIIEQELVDRGVLPPTEEAPAEEAPAQPDAAAPAEAAAPGVEGEGALNVKRTDADLASLSDEELVNEAISVPKTHVAGLGMEASEFSGMYLSTEEGGNRYATEATPQQAMTANIKNPKIFRSPFEYSMFKDQFLPDGYRTDQIQEAPEVQAIADGNEEAFAEIQAAPAKAAAALQQQGYDSVYLPESERNEGILVVFDRTKVTATPTPGAEGQAVATEKPQETPAEVVPPEKPPVAKAEPERPDPEDAIKALKKQLGRARRVAPKVRSEQREARRKRVAMAADRLSSEIKKGTPARQAALKSTQELRGPLTEYTGRYGSIRKTLGEKIVNALHLQIAQDPKLRYYERITLGSQLDALLDGDALTLFQARSLGKYFGDDIGKQAESRVPLSDRIWLTGLEILNIPRTSLASIDASGVLRQGRALLHGKPELTRQFIEYYARSFASEEFANNLDEQIKADPFYDEAHEVGLEMPLWGLVEADISQLAEEFMGARLLQRVPGIRASERSFVNALNWLRLAAYGGIVKHTELARNREMTFDEKRHLAKVINNLSGRTSLPNGLKQMAPILNAAFFSPRFALSRVAPLWDVPLGAYHGLKSGEMPPELKLEIRALSSMMGTNLAVLGLIGMVAAGDDDLDIQLDPRSSDFAKLRYKNFRVDLWAGYAQPARFLYRFATGKTMTQAGEVRDVDRWDIFRSFLTTKQSPLASLLHDWWTGETMGGRPFGAPEKGGLLEQSPLPEKLSGTLQETWNRLFPLVIQDTVDALVLQGVPEAIAGGSLAFGGVGIQTYEPSAFAVTKEKMNEISRETYSKDWDDLRPMEQKRLRREHKEIGVLEREARKKAYPITKLDLQEQAKVTKRIHDALSTPTQEALDEYRILTGITRRILSDFRLNEQRYAAYEQLATREIESVVTKIINGKRWSARNPKAKEQSLQKAVNDARSKARTLLVQQINKGDL